MEKIKEWLSKELPFVVYRKPNESICSGWFQKDSHLHVLTRLDQSCFVFAPFSGEEQVVFYPERCFLVEDFMDIDVNYSEEEKTLEDPKVDKAFHLNLVAKGIQAIQANEMEKVVLSRQEEIEVNERDYELYFRRFLKKYPTAFVYWFYHPKVGMWMGATPEQLVKITKKTVKTVALAATQVDKGTDLNKVVWGKKEQQEQQIVTEFIVKALNPFSETIKQTVPFTYRAGSLLHIKTDIEANLLSDESVYDVLKALHPTPALCGFPKEKARDFIIANEGYHRAYYGGFLGEWKFDHGKKSSNSDLFVNLRCMNLKGSKGYLFLGGGINKDSHPESEYYETVSKSKTVKSIL